MKKTTNVKLFLLLSLFCSSFAHSFVLDFDFFGLSAHLGDSYSKAPRGLDPEGKYVFNPGIGLGVDSRKKPLEGGFSFLSKIGFFEDCNAVPIYYGTVGFRYLYSFNNTFAAGASFNLALVNGQDWWTEERHYSFMPFPVLELRKRLFSNNALSLGTVIAPPDSSISATSGGALLFFMASYSHKI